MTRYIDNGDGTVTDNQTGLMWQQAEGEMFSFKKAQEYAVKLNLGGHEDWRVPLVSELISIVDYQRVNPVSDPIFRMASSSYWSSSSYAGNTSGAWRVNFNNGYVDINYKTFSYYARCVRDIKGVN